jgi:hypothetical protein
MLSIPLEKKEYRVVLYQQPFILVFNRYLFGYRAVCKLFFLRLYIIFMSSPGTAGIINALIALFKCSDFTIIRSVSKVGSVVELRVSGIFCNYSKNYFSVRQKLCDLELVKKRDGLCCFATLKKIK